MGRGPAQMSPFWCGLAPAWGICPVSSGPDQRPLPLSLGRGQPETPACRAGGGGARLRAGLQHFLVFTRYVFWGLEQRARGVAGCPSCHRSPERHLPQVPKCSLQELGRGGGGACCSTGRLRPAEASGVDSEIVLPTCLPAFRPAGPQGQLSPALGWCRMLFLATGVAVMTHSFGLCHLYC